MPKCSIVIPVYNRASLTRQCVRGLLRSPGTGIESEIIVVDDGSRDLTSRILAEYDDRIQIVRHTSNQGFASACNDGAAVASAEYVVFLNNDTVTRPLWLEELVAYADRFPAAGVVGAKLLFPNDTIQHAGVVICQDVYPRHIYAGFPADHPAVNKSRRFQAVTGACMLVRRSAFERVGGFDSGFRSGYEDVDLCLRLGELGYEIHYCHTSALHHLESASRQLPPEDLAHNTARYRARWAHRVKPDDLDYYLQDGLLGIDYSELFPLRLTVWPLLGVVDGPERTRFAERLLDQRARQVFGLMQENARLKVVANEAALRAAAHQPQATKLEVQANGAPLIDDSTLAALAPPLVDPNADLVPSDELIRSVGGQFRETGEEFFQYFIELCGLRPNERVLDVGCGVGRIAVPLTRYLQVGGSYEGFDIVRVGIEWCTQNITARYPNFRFQVADIYNKFYNPDGTFAGSEYRFPFEDSSFDLVVLTSVFTHMLPDEVANYLSEIRRVLRKGGRCLITFFLINSESQGLIDSGLCGDFRFNYARNGYRTLNPRTPESAVAYDEERVRDQFRKQQLRIVEPIRYGRWPGRPRGLSLQDIVLAVKESE